MQVFIYVRLGFTHLGAVPCLSLEVSFCYGGPRHPYTHQPFKDVALSKCSNTTLHFTDYTEFWRVLFFVTTTNWCRLSSINWSRLSTESKKEKAPKSLFVRRVRKREVRGPCKRSREYSRFSSQRLQEQMRVLLQ